MPPFYRSQGSNKCLANDLAPKNSWGSKVFADTSKQIGFDLLQIELVNKGWLFQMNSLLRI